MEENNIQLNDQPPQRQSNSYIGWIILAVVVVVIIAVLVGVLVGKTNGNGYLTYENYLKISNGMTYSQVVDILGGHAGTLDTSSSYEGYTMTVYSWSNNSGTKNIVVVFDNGKVSAKSQFGL